MEILVNDKLDLAEINEQLILDKLIEKKDAQARSMTKLGRRVFGVASVSPSLLIVKIQSSCSQNLICARKIFCALFSGIALAS